MSKTPDDKLKLRKVMFLSAVVLQIGSGLIFLVDVVFELTELPGTHGSS